MCFGGNKQPSAPINKPNYSTEDIDKNMSTTVEEEQDKDKRGSATQSSPVKM